jgi:glutathione S-transferase
MPLARRDGKIIMPKTSLTLVSHPLCPFVQRAAIILLEKDVPFDRIDVDLAAKPDWFLALSPTGKVPLLKVHQADGQDAVLFESMAICEYLEETQGGVAAYPDDALLRARQRAWIEFATQTLADAWQFLNAADQSTADAKQAAFRGKLQRLESCLGSGPYFHGVTFSMVDAVFAPLFRYFDMLDPGHVRQSGGESGCRRMAVGHAALASAMRDWFASAEASSSTMPSICM